jgi:hypothetical protein
MLLLADTDRDIGDGGDNVSGEMIENVFVIRISYLSH